MIDDSADMMCDLAAATHFDIHNADGVPDSSQESGNTEGHGITFSLHAAGSHGCCFVSGGLIQADQYST